MSNIKKLFVYSGAAAMLATTPGIVSAQDSGGLLEEIVVTARKRDENIQDVPISISAFSGDAVRTLGITEAKQFSSLTPSLEWKSPSEYAITNIYIRGIGDNSFSPNAVTAVAIYTDEVFLSSPAGANLLLLDLERVEVLKGPQGTLYGKNSTGGAINFISRKPNVEDGTNGYIYGKVGAFGEFGIEAAIGAALGDQTAVRAAVKWGVDDGPVDYVNVPDAEGPNRDTVAWRLALSHDLNDDASLLLNVHGSDNKSNVPGKFGGLLDPAGTFGPCPALTGNARTSLACVDAFGQSPSADYDVNDSSFVGTEGVENVGGSIRLDWDLGSVTLTTITAYEELESFFIDDLDHSAFDAFQFDLDNEQSQFSQEVRLTSNNDDGFGWTLGAHYFEEDTEAFTDIHSRGFGPGGLSGALAGFSISTGIEGVGQTITQDVKSYALFGESYFDLNDRTRITAGIRWTKEEKEFALLSGFYNVNVGPGELPSAALFNQTFIFPTVQQTGNPDWSEFSGRLAVDYRPNDDILLYGSWSRGFKAGGFNGGALFSQAEASIVDPEFLSAFEVGMKSTLADGRARLNIAAFVYDFTDQQIFNLDSTGTPSPQLTNAGESTVRGLEVELEAEPWDAFYARVGGSILNTQFDTGGLAGNDLPSAPDLSFSGILRYTWNAGGDNSFYAQTDFSYNDDRFFNPDNVVFHDSYWLVGASLGYNFGSEGQYSAVLWLKNAFDEDYYTDGNDGLAFIGNRNLAPGAPRTYGLTVGTEF